MRDWRLPVLLAKGASLMSVKPEEVRVTRRAAQAAETRERVLDAAIAAFSANAYDDVAVADIAKSAGVAHGLLFHYFDNKRGVYRAAMQRALAQLNESFEIRPGLSPDEQLRNSMERHLRFLSTHKDLALRLIMGAGSADPESRDIFESGRWQVFELFAPLLGVDPREMSVQLVGRTIIGGIDEATRYWLEHDEPVEIDTMVNFLVELFKAATFAAGHLSASTGTSRAGDPVDTK